MPRTVVMVFQFSSTFAGLEDRLTFQKKYINCFVNTKQTTPDPERCKTFDRGLCDNDPFNNNIEWQSPSAFQYAQIQLQGAMPHDRSHDLVTGVKLAVFLLMCEFHVIMIR